MATKLTAHEQPVSRIFSDDYVFSIPGYQRPYAWTTEQAKDLLDDLSGFMAAHPGEIEDIPPYFLGSIVLIKSDTLPDADVVDGQQRLTTLTILLSAIRSLVSASNREDITHLLYEKGSRILGTHDRFRLSLRERDKEFFKKYIQREDGFSDLLLLDHVESDSQKNIRDNAQLFHESLKSLSEQDQLNLAQFIVTRCFLVIVATPDLDSAYRIFSVLNSRGLDLSATDILKAQIIGDTPLKDRSAFTNKWETVEEDLGRSWFNDLFSHIRTVYRKAKSQGTLLKEFKEHVLKDMKPNFFVDNVLLPMSEVYEFLKSASYESSERAEIVNRHLKWLNKLEFADWMPPALSFSVRHRSKPARMEEFFRDLDRLAYWMLITRAGINERIERFSRLTKAIENNVDLFAPESPLQLNPIEKGVAYDVLNGPIYKKLSARARSLVLLRLDALLSAGGAEYDYDIVTVEHVLPQNPAPDSEWVTWFEDPTDREQLVHRIGNLALLTRKKNSAASNYDFDRKKAAYFTRNGVSPFVLTTQVLQHAEWTPELVVQRQEELLGILERHWRLEDRDAMEYLNL